MLYLAYCKLDTGTKAQRGGENIVLWGYFSAVGPGRLVKKGIGK